MNLKRGEIVGGDLVTGACAMSGRWSLSGNYDVLVRYTATTPDGVDSIPLRSIEERLASLL